MQLNILYSTSYNRRVHLPNGLHQFEIDSFFKYIQENGLDERGGCPDVKDALSGENNQDPYVKKGPFISSDIAKGNRFSYFGIDNLPEDDRKYIYPIELLHAPGIQVSWGTIPKKVWDMVNEDRCIIVFDYEHEGKFDYHEFNTWWNYTWQIWKPFVKLENIYFLTGDLNCKMHLSDSDLRKQFIPMIHFVETYAKEAVTLLDRNQLHDGHLGYTWKKHTIDDIDIENKFKYFYCPMRNCEKDHRKALGLYFEKHQLWKDNNISFLKVGYKKGKYPLQFYHKKPNVMKGKYEKTPLMERLEHGLLSKLDERRPVQFDTFDLPEEKMESFTSGFADNWDRYQECFLHIVSETIFTEQKGINNVFLSEKIFKPIVNLHPFIVFASRFTLRELKKLGFKTFHPFIDESYDRIDNDETRFLMLLDELDKFRKWTPEELKEWWKSILPILKHNQDVFYEMGRNESRKNKWLREVL